MHMKQAKMDDMCMMFTVYFWTTSIPSEQQTWHGRRWQEK